MSAAWMAAAALVVVAGGLGLVGMRGRLVPVRVEGVSMEPTLRAGERILVRYAAADRVRRGQVVVLADPGARPGTRATHGWVVKRVAALPGDRPPVAVARHPSGAPVPPGWLAVLGDNPAHSVDSRHYGLVPTDRVLGVALVHRPRR